MIFQVCRYRISRPVLVPRVDNLGVPDDLSYLLPDKYVGKSGFLRALNQAAETDKEYDAKRK
jgi:hypothetical protein